MRNKTCFKIMLAVMICILGLNFTGLAAEYELSNPDELDFGPKETVVFMNEEVVYIDGNFYEYRAFVRDYDWVRLTQSGSRDLYEWNYIEDRGVFTASLNPHPEEPVCVRTADGETFESLTEAMYHILGYVVRGEEMPVRVKLGAR